MRKLFSRQLIEARHEMLSIFESIDLTLHDAVTAFVTDDMELARRAKKKTYKIDARCANLEAVCYNLIATQSPVASDFRLLQTIIYVDFNLQRMSDKVRRIARAAKRKVNNDIEFPAEMIALIEQEAASVYQVLGSTAAALVNNDLAAVLALSEEDEAVHGAYQEFFRVFNRTETMEVADDAPDGRFPSYRHGLALPRPHREHRHGVRISPRLPAHRSALERRRHRRCG